MIQAVGLPGANDDGGAGPGRPPAAAAADVVVLGLVDHLQVDLRDVRTERVIRMAGSLAWKLSRA